MDFEFNHPQSSLPRREVQGEELHEFQDLVEGLPRREPLAARRSPLGSLRVRRVDAKAGGWQDVSGKTWCLLRCLNLWPGWIRAGCP